MRPDRTLEEILIEIGRMNDNHIMACTKGEYDLLLRQQLNFNKLKNANKVRCINGFGHSLGSWMIDQWTNAIAGETGEACNLAKKLNRISNNIKGNKPEDGDFSLIKEKLGKELADVVIYCDLTASALDMNLGDLVKQKFNEKSDEIGSDIKL